MKLIVKSTLAATAALLIGTPAMAGVIGLFYIGPDTQQGVAVQKTNGKIDLLIQIAGNTEGTKYGVSPGNVFNPASVFELDGKNMLVLSLMENTKGMPSHALVTVDSQTVTTLQRTNLTDIVSAMAKMKYLRNKDGKTDYQPEDIQGVILVYQYRPTGAMDSSLGAKILSFDDLSEGGVIQLLGTEVTPVP